MPDDATEGVAEHSSRLHTTTCIDAIVPVLKFGYANKFSWHYPLKIINKFFWKSDVAYFIFHFQELLLLKLTMRRSEFC